MRLKVCLALGSIIFLTSCATGNNGYYTQTVQSWRGGNVNALVERWGRPDNRAMAPNGNLFYVYKTESYHTYNSPASPQIGVHFAPGGRPVMTSGMQTNNTWNRNMSISCIAAFEINPKGKIVDVQTQGKNCYEGEGFANRMKNPSAGALVQ